MPRIPGYPYDDVQVSPRIGVLVEQRVPFNSWANHLQQGYYDQESIPKWTLEHAYDNPLAPLHRALPSPDKPYRPSDPQPWY